MAVQIARPRGIGDETAWNADARPQRQVRSVAHFIDDPALGGVTRSLANLQEQLTGRYEMSRYCVSPTRAIAPRVAEDAAVVHFTASWIKMPFLGLLRARMARRPLVLVEHTYTAEFEQLLVGDRNRFRAMLRLAYGLMDHVVAVGEAQAAWMRDAQLAPTHKISVIHPATDCQNLFSLPPPAAGPRPLRLVAYGRYCYQKNFDLLVAAMRDVDPSVATLRIAGYGPEEAALRELSADLPHVEIGGVVKHPGELLGDASALVIPSRWEGYCQVAVEARAAARPIIACDVTGLGEQVWPQTGLLVPAGDAKALAAAIRSLAERDIAAMGLAARRSVAGNHAANAERWRALLSA